MEVLGFFDDPEQKSADRVPPSLPGPPPQVRRGKHERPPPDPVSSGQPAELGSKLVGRDTRWGLVVVALAMMGLVAAGAFWLYNRPNLLAQQAVADVMDRAGSLQTELVALAQLNQGLDDPALELEALGPQLTAVEGRARELFSAAGELSREQAAMRSLAAEAAEAALDSSRRLGATHGFRAAVIPLLVPPALETDPGLVSLEQAAADFADWQARFGAVLGALAGGGMEDVMHALENVSAGSERVLPSYLDAISDRNPEAAQTAIHDLVVMLAETEALLGSRLVEVKTEIDADLQRSLQALELLLG